MGILCQLTVSQGAVPGAAAAYERKIRELAARADLQKALQEQRKQKEEEQQQKQSAPAPGQAANEQKQADQSKQDDQQQLSSFDEESIPRQIAPA